MARTRGISHQFHQDDGVLLGKDGEPIPVNPNPAPVPLDRDGNYVSPAVALAEPPRSMSGHAVALAEPPRSMSGHAVVRGPGAEPLAAPVETIAYRADARSWSRNMEAWELAHLLDLAFRHSPDEMVEGFAVVLPPDVFATLPPDVKRHFVAVRG